MKAVLLFFILSLFSGANDLENPRLSFFDIRHNQELGFTSTILNSSKSKKFIEPEKDGFYGMYYGFEKHETKDPVKYTVTVWDNKKPWKSESNSQRLLEVVCRGKVIKVFGDIGVGVSSDFIKERLGPPTIISGEFMIYASKTYSYSFLIKEKKLVAYRFGLYQDHPTQSKIPDYLIDFEK